MSEWGKSIYRTDMFMVWGGGVPTEKLLQRLCARKIHFGLETRMYINSTGETCKGTWGFVSPFR